MTTKIIERAIEEARKFGDSYLGEACFDVLKDTKKVERYIKKNEIKDCFLCHRCNGDHRDGWYIICP